MLSGTLKVLTYSPGNAVLLLGLLTVGGGRAGSVCTNRRCLAESLIKKNYSSQPQYENCTQMIRVPVIVYQTLSVDTKNLRLISRLEATVVWEDPELGWDTSVYKYHEVTLPVDKVWTPEIHVTNGIKTTMKHSSRDLLVYSNGTLRHTVTINAVVNCKVNLFNYPFSADECPVAIQTWSSDGCGTKLVLGELKMVDSNSGDWETDEVDLKKKRDDRNYIMVSLSVRFANAFVTLLMPSILIMLADVVSFALPLGGGERNTFKVTLVLSFIMFLIILNDNLPGGGRCSPIIRTHFCVCLVFLVVSMLVSMMLTRVANDGSLLSCSWSKGPVPKNTGNKEERENEEAEAGISVNKLNGSEEDKQMLRKVVNFLEAFEAKELESEKYKRFANTVDKICFWFYLFFDATYFFTMAYVMVKSECKINHFGFWD